MDGLQKISGCDSPNRAADIIFVHGLDGDACTTWHPKDRPDAFWPAWLGEDIPAVGVWSLGYAVSASAWKGHTMPLADRATNILDWLELDGIGCRPVMFICHSLGGLLVKQVLRHAGDFGNPAWKAVATQTKAVVFLSTPHSGADLASWVQYIGGLLRATVSVEELEAHHPRLRELNLWYRNHVADLGIKTVVYCEKRPVAGILVVNETTADPGIAEVIPIPVDEDHVSICKPVSKDSQIYRRVKRLVEDIVNLSRPSGVVAGGSPFRRYYWDCIERWSEPRHALDKRFVHLTLLIDQGEEAQGLRWAPQARTFQDLRQVLAAVPDPALVLLGPPGSGKSTLLQHVEVDYARDALNRDDPKPSNIRLTFFVSLNLYKAAAGEKLLSPKTWLEQRWAARTDRYSELPTLDSLLQEGCLVLLLDALNEMPHQHTEHIDAWQDFLARLVEERPGNRVIFSCRTLDYGAKLSTKALPVPQVQIEQLSNEQVREFIEKYTAQRPEALWRELSRDTRQLDLYRSPYYLKLLVDQAGPEGKIPRGRAMLFSGFVRQALNREVAGKHPLFKPGVLLTAHECERMAGNAYTGCELPTENPLLTTLSALAYRMQETEQNPEASQVRMERSLTLAVLGTMEPATEGFWSMLKTWLGRNSPPDMQRAEQILTAGLALNVLVLDEKQKDVLFFHQLLQEYFAARRLAMKPEPRLLRVPWRADRVPESLQKTLAGLADSDPLPPLPGTGWEETAVLAAAMATDAAAFVTGLMPTNLALAGRCAAQPDVHVSTSVKEALHHALIQRTQDSTADLRARIAAGLALGELGGPRFQRCQGPHGEFLLPPLITIPGGTYTIGSDEGHYDDEAPVHAVELQPFQLGQFPVTNAEYAQFLKAGGYEDERWWDTETAQAWRCGESTAEGAKQQWRENRQTFQANFAQIRDLHQQGRITSKQADDWEQIARMDDDAFEALLDERYPPGRQTQPAFWNDEAFNNPAQPVVGVCWYEARAYCTWLSAQTGQAFRLPTEAEWEAAARGRDGRRYAYGNEFDAKLCNTFESHIRRNTPSGVFPGGETPEGLIDMTGNTWDWTGSKYQPYPYDTADGREDPAGDARRVVRGGSWDSFRTYARAACRYSYAPGGRNYDVGFRLACASPI